MRYSILGGLAVGLLATTATLAQQRPLAPTAGSDIVAQPIVPVPGDGNIVVKFGETAQVYFARPIKSMKVDDNLVVQIVPQTDHVVAITGLAPGERTIRMTSGESDEFVAATVVVVRDPHFVRIFQQGQINRITGERRSDSASNIGGYVTLNCNEVKCAEVEPELKPVLPR